jgi:hypothetical protein
MVAFLKAPSHFRRLSHAETDDLLAVLGCIYWHRVDAKEFAIFKNNVVRG